jgi:succinate-semialdehyde dehydrogenase / glutarate-semialdehyde dehydrogenase
VESGPGEVAGGRLKRIFIGLLENRGRMKIISINPFTEDIIAEYRQMRPDEVDREVQKSRRSFSSWANLSVAERVAYIAKLADNLRADKRKYAEIITREMGKPIRESVAEIEKCALACDYYAQNAEKFLEPEKVPAAGRSYILFQPLGIVLGIMPWNFPFWQVFRFAIPALAAGNVVLLKHAYNVPACALAIEDAFLKAGFPKNVFKTLIIGAQDALKLIEDDKVNAVSLTGSTKAGEEVAAAAGKRIKKVVLELGGSDPFVVLDDADIAASADMAVKARTINTGQSCIAAKRFMVMESVADEFKKIFLARLMELKVGDPMDEATDIGPVAKREVLDTLNEQLNDAKAKGAEIHQATHIFDRGLFFLPCAVFNPTKEMRILTEEVFGPIAPVITVRDEDEAVRAANDTGFGLGASIWSKDHKRAERLARRLDAGFVAVNDMVKSDPRLPFGGVKKSGIGRELSHYGLKEFVNIKTVAIKE